MAAGGGDEIRSLLFDQEATELDAYRIGQTLSKVWKDFQAASPEKACVRVRTMNLLVVCSSPADAEGLAAKLTDITQLFPGRIVAVVLDQDYHGPIRGWYRVEQTPGHPEQLGCELVGLHSSADGKPLPSLLAPVWEQGLPIFLWWCGRPRYEEAWMNHLAETAQRIILDTGCTGTLARAMGGPLEAAEPLARVAEVVEDRYHQELAYNDLNWGRLRTWRDLVAGMFDTEERLALLEGLQQIEIVTWAMPRDITPSLPALYTAGWLARQLGYKVSQALQSVDNGQQAVLRPSSHQERPEVKLVLNYQPTQDDELVARLSRVILSGEHDGHAFRVAVERDERDTTMMMRKSGCTKMPSLFNSLQLTRLSHRQLLGMELETFGRDGIFEGSLRKALDIAGIGVAPTADKRYLTSV